MKIIKVFLATVVAISLASAASIEYTPNNTRVAAASQANGGHYEALPFKALMTNDRLATTFGLIYWPGEQISVTINGGTADRLSCKNMVNPSDSLPCVNAGSAWRIITTAPGKTAPYMAVYRVVAYSGGAEIASRGLIVTLPWSGHYTNENARLSNTQLCLFGDGHLVDYFSAYGWSLPKPMYNLSPEYVPLRNVPFGWTTQFGLADLAYKPRSNGIAHTGYWYEVDNTPYTPYNTEQAFADSTFEWNSWWTYVQCGNNNRVAEAPTFGWGPWNGYSAEAMSKDANGVMGSSGSDENARTVYQGLIPNGLAFHQMYYYFWYGNLQVVIWRYKGLNYNDDTKPVIVMADAWGPGYGCSEQLVRYYISRYFNTSDRAFIDSKYIHTKYHINKILELATHDAYQWYYKRPANYYTYGWSGGDITYRLSGSSGTLFEADNNRTLVTTVCGMYANGLLGAWASGGGDYGQDRENHDNGSNYFRYTRSYRYSGYDGLLQTVFSQPHAIYFGGNQVNSGLVPGSDMDPGETLQNTNGNLYTRLFCNRQYSNDGLSHRRFTMFEKLPMWYGVGLADMPDTLNIKLRYNQRSFLFSTATSITDKELSTTQLWNNQIMHGDQLMYIPDRTAPIGGVEIFDCPDGSSLPDNQKYCGGQWYVDLRPMPPRYIPGTYGRPRIALRGDLCSVLMDSLGIMTYANPDMAKYIPSHIPRIHWPKMDGANGRSLVAEMPGGQRISVKLSSYPVVKGPVPGDYDNHKFLDFGPPSWPDLLNFIGQVKAAYPGGWPIGTTGGFAATGWESSKGTWVYVENPMEDSAHIHTARTGSVYVRLRGFPSGGAKPAVIDLAGGTDGLDPVRLADNQVTMNGDKVTFNLSWPNGDVRLFYIDYTTPVGTVMPALRPTNNSLPVYFTMLNKNCLVHVFGARPHVVKVFRLDGRQIASYSGSAERSYTIGAKQVGGSGVYMVTVLTGGKSYTQRFMVAR